LEKGKSKMITNIENKSEKDLIIRAGLLILTVLQLLMLAALYTRTVPHPPLEVAPFALGPFISASIALAVAALATPIGRLGSSLIVVACLTALVSYGPQKWFDPAIGGIWPAVLVAQCAVIAILTQMVSRIREPR